MQKTLKVYETGAFMCVQEKDDGATRWMQVVLPESHSMSGQFEVVNLHQDQIVRLEHYCHEFLGCGTSPVDKLPSGAVSCEMIASTIMSALEAGRPVEFKSDGTVLIGVKS